jgi:hypothetical protein
VVVLVTLSTSICGAFESPLSAPSAALASDTLGVGDVPCSCTGGSPVDAGGFALFIGGVAAAFFFTTGGGPLRAVPGEDFAALAPASSVLESEA